MIEKFELKVIELKKRLGEKNMYLIFFVIFGIVMLFSLSMANNYKRNRNALMDIYNRSIYDLVGYIENIEAYSLKSTITQSTKYSITTYSKTATYAGLAKSLVSTLPLAQEDLESISKFLSQTVGYYTYLVDKVSSGDALTDSDNKILDILNKKYVSLAKIFKEIYNDLSHGSLKWDEVEDVASKKLQGKALTDDNIPNVFSISKPFTEYEGLIYDGAFSNHLETLKPRLIESKKEISKEEGKKIVREKIQNIFLEEKNKKDNNDNIESITFTNEIKGNLELYEYDIKFKNIKNSITVQITKKGGFINLLMENSEEKEDKEKNNLYEEKNIDTEKEISEDKSAKIKALKFLQNIGINNMVPTYFTNTDGEVLINFAAKQNDTIIYTDLIKVKVNLKEDRITFVECTGYIFNHHNRNIDKDIISVEEAIEKVNKNINVEKDHVNLTIIPNDAKKELLCYEIKGKRGDNNFLVYINAKTGIEENVLILLDTEGGKLTI